MCDSCAWELRDDRFVHASSEAAVVEDLRVLRVRVRRALSVKSRCLGYDKTTNANRPRTVRLSYVRAFAQRVGVKIYVRLSHRGAWNLNKRAPARAGHWGREAASGFSVCRLSTT